ncbi:hypothetical protein [Paraglaciecola aestuariivivens]
MPSTFQYYFHQTLFYITIPVFAALIYFFGENPEHFDIIYIFALGISCLFCWHDKDTLGALAILLGLWICSRLLFISLDINFGLFLIYFFSLCITFYCFSQNVAKVVFLLILFSIGCEIYWEYIDYSNRPQITYFVGTLSFIVLARELLFNRVFIAHKYFGYASGKIALDWQLRGVLLADSVLVICMLLEYFMRHILGFSHATMVYYNFSLSASILSGLTLSIVYMHYFYNQSKKHLLA